jgi:hypothetical protein
MSMKKKYLSLIFSALAVGVLFLKVMARHHKNEPVAKSREPATADKEKNTQDPTLLPEQPEAAGKAGDGDHATANPHNEIPTQPTDSTITKATRTIAQWTRILVGVTALYAFISLLQLCQIKRQVDSTAEQFRVSHRPWVSPAKEPVPNIPADYKPDDHTRMNVTFVLRNNGSAPAIGTVINPKLQFGDVWPPEVSPFPECDPKSLDEISQKGKYGDFIIPGVETQPIRRDVEWREGSQGDKVFLVGCIAYTNEVFRNVKPGCLPYVMSFAWELSKDNDGKWCFIYQGYGYVQNYESPEKCPK